MCCRQKSINTTTKIKIKHNNSCRNWKSNSGTLSIPTRRCVTTALPNQLKVAIVVKIFNCLTHLMGRNVKCLWATPFQHIHVFCNILTCMKNYSIVVVVVVVVVVVFCFLVLTITTSGNMYNWKRTKSVLK